MARAARKSTTTETKCPAAAMATLIGVHWKIYDDLDGLRPADDGDVSLQRRAMDAAARISDVAEEALPLAPAQSLPGAIAKFIMALKFLHDVTGDDHMDSFDIARKQFLSRMLVEDAMDYFARHHSITATGLGLDQLMMPGPRSTVAESMRLIGGAPNGK